MLQIKFFYYDLHKPNGAKSETIENQINEWLKNAGNIVILTEDSAPSEISQGHLIWQIWYEDYNNENESENVSRSMRSLDLADIIEEE